MSEGGTVGGLPISQYQIGPRDDSHLIKPVGEFVGRSVMSFEPSDQYVAVDRQSSVYQRAKAFLKKR